MLFQILSHVTLHVIPERQLKADRPICLLSQSTQTCELQILNETRLQGRFAAEGRKICRVFLDRKHQSIQTSYATQPARKPMYTPKSQTSPIQQAIPSMRTLGRQVRPLIEIQTKTHCILGNCQQSRLQKAREKQCCRLFAECMLISSKRSHATQFVQFSMPRPERPPS